VEDCLLFGVDDLELGSEVEVVEIELVRGLFSLCWLRRDPAFVAGGPDAGDEVDDASAAFLKISRKASRAVGLSSAVWVDR